MYSGQLPPPIDGYSPWFMLTEATLTLKGLLFPNFFDSEMDHHYVLGNFGGIKFANLATYTHKTIIW
jgi:hypothetical protein